MSAAQNSWVVSISLSPPSLKDNTADADRLAAGLARELGIARPDIPIAVLRDLSARLRSWDYRARCVLFRDRDRWVLVDVADPRGQETLAGLAVDLGTTRVVARLVDLESGANLAECAFDNPQVVVGPDILSRVHHAAEPDGRKDLQRAIVDELNQQVRALCQTAAIAPGDVHLAAVAGNTAMTHFLLGLDPRGVIREPYIPVCNWPGLQRADDLGLLLRPTAQVFVFPNVGSYFGGDLLAGILHAGLHRRSEVSLLVDVGTNAEVVLGNQDWLVACAGAAGPALETGVAEVGMLAGDGVIDRVRIDPRSHAFDLHTIGDSPPRGICGSGLIDLAAQLFLSGMIDLRGQLVREICGERLRQNEDGQAELLLVPAAEAAGGRDLTIDQRGLTSLKKAKAAMFTILETLCATVGLTPEQAERFFVAGTFGSVIDPRSAIAIGMLPDLPLERFVVLGNSSLEGATELLGDPGAMDIIQADRARITYVELNVNQDFMNRFSGAQFFPHTNPARFPSVQVWSSTKS